MVIKSYNHPRITEDVQFYGIPDNINTSYSVKQKEYTLPWSDKNVFISASTLVLYLL